MSRPANELLDLLAEPFEPSYSFNYEVEEPNEPALPLEQDGDAPAEEPLPELDMRVLATPVTQAVPPIPAPWEQAFTPNDWTHPFDWSQPTALVPEPENLEAQPAEVAAASYLEAQPFEDADADIRPSVQSDLAVGQDDEQTSSIWEPPAPEDLLAEYASSPEPDDQSRETSLLAAERESVSFGSGLMLSHANLEAVESEQWAALGVPTDGSFDVQPEDEPMGELLDAIERLGDRLQPSAQPHSSPTTRAQEREANHAPREKEPPRPVGPNVSVKVRR